MIYEATTQSRIMFKAVPRKALSAVSFEWAGVPFSSVTLRYDDGNRLEIRATSERSLSALMRWTEKWISALREG